MDQRFADADALRSAKQPMSMRMIWALVIVRLGIPLAAVDAAWGVHRDEFLYFAMADHLDLLRMQFPPLISVVAWIGRAAFGESVAAARVPAAIGGAATVFVVLWFVRRLGGGRVAGLVSWIALLAAPLFVRSSLLMHPVVFEQLWASCALAALTLASVEREPRWWLGVGVGLGFCCLTKFSAAFIGAGVMAGSLVAPTLRRQWMTRWPWVGVVVCGLLAIPAVSGQIVHGWPFLAQMVALKSSQLARLDRSAIVIGQPMMLAGAVPCILAAFLDIRSRGATTRPAAMAAVVMLVTIVTLRGKAYYVGPVYPVLIGIGALTLEGWIRRHRVGGALLAGAMASTAGMLLPLGVPVFPPAMLLRYTEVLGVEEAVVTARGSVSVLPADYADMLGWAELADTVSAAVRRLPESRRRDITLAGSNYGEAGALAFYRQSRALPYPVSLRGDFWAWGPGPASGNTVMVVGREGRPPALTSGYRTVAVVAGVRNPLAVREEQALSVYLATDATVPLAARWPHLGPNWD